MEGVMMDQANVSLEDTLPSPSDAQVHTDSADATLPTHDDKSSDSTTTTTTVYTEAPADVDSADPIAHAESKAPASANSTSSATTAATAHTEEAKKTLADVADIEGVFLTQRSTYDSLLQNSYELSGASITQWLPGQILANAKYGKRYVTLAREGTTRVRVMELPEANATGPLDLPSFRCEKHGLTFVKHGQIGWLQRVDADVSSWLEPPAGKKRWGRTRRAAVKVTVSSRKRTSGRRGKADSGEEEWDGDSNSGGGTGDEESTSAHTPEKKKKPGRKRKQTSED